MIKKVFSLMLIIITLCLIISNVYASDNDKIKNLHKSLQIELLEDDAEKDTIVNKLHSNLTDDFSKNMDWGSGRKELGEYYKIYWIRQNLRTYFDDKNFDKFFNSSTILWEVPVKDENGDVISTMRAVKADGKWGISAGFSIKKEMVDFYLNPENLSNLLNNSKIKPQSVKHVRIKELYLDFYYVKDGNNNYVIPFSHMQKGLKLENFKIYELDDFMNIIKDQYVDPKTQNNSSTSDKFGGSKGISSNASLINSVSLCVAFLLLILFTIIFVRKRRFKNQ